jgi:hypothetical protein
MKSYEAYLVFYECFFIFASQPCAEMELKAIHRKRPSGGLRLSGKVLLVCCLAWNLL